MLSSGTKRHPQFEHPLKNSAQNSILLAKIKKVQKIALRKLQSFLSEGQFHRQLFPHLESRQSNCQILSWCKAGNDVCPKTWCFTPREDLACSFQSGKRPCFHLQCVWDRQKFL